VTLASDGPPGLLDIVGVCYEAGNDPGLWPEALRLIRRATSARAALLIEIDRATERRRLLAQSGLSDQAALHYENEQIKSDSGLPNAPAPKSSLRPVTIADAPNGATTIRLQVLATDHTSQYLLVRRDGGVAEQDAALALIERLAPHLGRSARIAEKTIRLSAIVESAKAAFEALEIGVALIDRDGRTILSNRRAEELLDQNGSTLGIDARAAAMLDTRDPRRPFGPHDGKPNGEAPLGPVKRAGRIRCVALSEPSETPHGVPVFMLLASAEESSDDADRLDRCKRLYGLTPAESKLAVALAAGKSLGEAAEAFNISKYTARAQLRQIFAKTDTHRQAELVKLLLSPPQSGV
jgi:DNA-binding CsgD family transcriptional regulator